MMYLTKNLIAAIFYVMVTLNLPLPLCAQDVDKLQRFEQLKQGLVAKGVPNNELALNYLALELFYNIPSRALVAKSLDKVKIKTYGIDLDQLSNLFPAANINRTSIIRAIKISGHDSYFAWVSTDPNVFFVTKKSDDGKIMPTATNAFVEANKRIADLQLDHVYEHSIVNLGKADDIVRPLKTFLSDSSAIYPLHSFLGSPLLAQLAAQHGVTEYQFIKDQLVPSFADLMFKVYFRAGLWTDSHTQNLWLVVSKDGSFHLAVKDFSMIAADFLIRRSDSTYPEIAIDRFGHLIPNEEQLREVNHGNAVETEGQITDISLNFARYAYQTILLGGKFSLNQEIQLLETFFGRFISNINQHYGIRIQLSEDINDIFKNKDKISHQLDIKGFDVWTGMGLFQRVGGLFGLSATIMRQIQKQIYDHVIGPKYYPSGNLAQIELKKFFENEKFRLLIAKQIPSTLGIANPNTLKATINFIFKFFVVVPIYKAFLVPRYLYYMFGGHYEYSDNYVLKVNRKGEVISAVSRGKQSEEFANKYKTCRSHFGH